MMTSGAPAIPPRRTKGKIPGAASPHKQQGSYDYDGEENYNDYQYEQQQLNNSQRAISMKKTQHQQVMYEDENIGYSASFLRNILDEPPETTIGKAVKMKGELSFEKLLRVDGYFEGTLISKGDLVVGKTGHIVGDIKDMGIVVTEGKIIGNMVVERVELRGKAIVHGNITCKSIKIDPTVIMVGTLNVNPSAPLHVDHDCNVLPESADHGAGGDLQNETTRIPADK